MKTFTSVPATSRLSAVLVALLAGVAVAGSGCKQTGLGQSLGSPKAALGGQSGSTVVNATFPNPCEIDLDFGNLPIGLTDSVTVRISNSGSSALDLSPITPTLDPEFSLSYPAEQPSIPGGGFDAFSVTFQPYRVGQVQSSFTIQTDGVNGLCHAPAAGSAGNVVTVMLAGNGIQLSLVVQPNVLDFGNTLINTTVKKSVMLINKSTAAVSGITATVAGSDEKLFTIDDAPTSLGAGESATVDISYAPVAIEVRSIATVTFEGSDKEMATLNLFGEPVGVALTLAPNPINFGYVPLGTTAVGCTTVSNQANLTVNVTGVTSFDTESNAWALATSDDATPPNPQTFPGTPIAIAGGASAKVCFSLTPLISQQYTSQAQLVTDDPSGNNPIVQLTGWGGGPQISCSPMSIAFGQTLTHSTSTVPVLCTNTGTALPGISLIIDPPSASPGVFNAQFDPSHDIYPLQGLAPGQVAQIDANYEPTSASNDQGSLFIKSNGGQGKTIHIPLTGSGLNVAPCQFVIAPSQLNFANVQAGDTSTMLSFEVENIGTDICLVQGLTIQNDATAAFHVLSTSIQPDPVTNKITIPAPATGVASNLTVTLDFAPTDQGAFSAEVAFAISNPSDPNQVVPLTGTSESTCLVIAPPNVNFGDVGSNDAGVLCSSASRTFSIFNECQTAATVQSLMVQNGPGDLVQQFSTPAGPPLPLTIQPGAAAQIYEMFFEPSTLGSHTAQLLISDGTVDTILPLSGAAVSTGTETDSFVVGPPKADILFIMDVDDDPEEQATITMEIPTFITAAKDIDYRIAVTTDDDGPGYATAEFGHLLPCPTCSMQGPTPTIISPSTVPAGGNAPDPTTAFKTLWSSVPNRVPYGADEHFFVALYNALQHGPQPGVDFFRPGVFFAAITDNGDNEADSSIHGKGSHNPTWYANFFETYFQNPFLFTWNYINPTQTKTGTGFSNYLELPPSIQQMISATNGFALNTSDPVWANALTSVWTSAITAHTYYPLVGSPSEGQSGIAVTVNGVLIPATSGASVNWTYQATLNAIVFNPNTDPPKIGAQISVTYPIGCK
jgi:hypothetical protein